MFSYTLYDTLFGEERVKQIIAAKRLLEDQKLTLYDLWRNYRRRRTWVPLIEHPYLIDFVQEVFDVLKGTRYYRYHGKLENKIDLIVRPWEETNFFRFYTSIPASVGRLPPPYDLCSYRVSEEDSVAADLMTRSIAQSSVELLSPLPYLNTFSESNIGPLHQKERVHVILVLKMMLEYGIIELDYFEYIVDLAYDLRELIGLLSDIGIGVSYDFISLADDLLDRLYDSRGTLTEAPKYTDQQSIVRLNELDTI